MPFKSTISFKSKRVCTSLKSQKTYQNFKTFKGHFFSEDSGSPKKWNVKIHGKLLNGIFWTFKRHEASIQIPRSDFQARKPQNQAQKSPKKAI